MTLRMTRKRFRRDLAPLPPPAPEELQCSLTRMSLEIPASRGRGIVQSDAVQSGNLISNWVSQEALQAGAP